MPIYKTSGTKDGKQKYNVRINYIDNLGAYRQITRVAYGKDEARLLEYKLQNEVKEAPVSKRITLQKLYEEYCLSMQGEIRRTTLEKNKEILNNHVLPELSAYSLDKLTAPVLNKWKNSVQTKELSLRHKQNIFSAFRALLNFAVKLDYLPNNPLVRVGNFRDSSEQKKEMLFYTADEFLQYIKEARKIASEGGKLIDWDYYVFFAIAFYTGARKGEIHALRWTDIKGNILNISKSISQKLKTGDIETPPKNKSSIRKIQIPDPLADILAEHKKRYSRLPDFNPSYFICGGTKPLRDSSIENRNKLFATSAGVKKIRIHDFRHSHASLLIHHGINIQEISRRLGHSDVKETLNTYAHLYPKEEEKAVAILNEIK